MNEIKQTILDHLYVEVCYKCKNVKKCEETNYECPALKILAKICSLLEDEGAIISYE